MTGQESANQTQLPPNEKLWDEDDRRLIEERLLDHMVLGETADIRVGMWFPIEVGGQIRIENIDEEVEAIEDTFDELGVEVRVPLVGVSQENHTTPMQAYNVEIEDWKSRSRIVADED